MDIVIEAISSSSIPSRHARRRQNPRATPSLSGQRNHRSPLKLSVFSNSHLSLTASQTRHPKTELPFSEVHAAAREGRLLPVLGHYAAVSRTSLCSNRLPAMAKALRPALRRSVGCVEAREFVKAGVCRNGYCLAWPLCSRPHGSHSLLSGGHLSKSDQI